MGWRKEFSMLAVAVIAVPALFLSRDDGSDPLSPLRVGRAGMAQAPGASSSRYSVLSTPAPAPRASRSPGW